MNKLFTYINDQLENNKNMKSFEINQDPFYQNQIKEAKEKLVKDRTFLLDKMRGKTFTSSDKFEEQKSEIFDNIKGEVEKKFETGFNWDGAFQQPDMQNWLHLYERASKTKFKSNTDCAQEIDTILGRESPIEYGGPRDLEMLYDYLTNFMSNPDALHMCESIIKYYKFGSMFAFC